MESKVLARAIQEKLATHTKPLTYAQILDIVDRAGGYRDHNHAAAHSRHQYNAKTAFYIHIDNGGYSFDWSEITSTLRIEVSFFGYSIHEQAFVLSSKQRKALLGMHLEWCLYTQMLGEDCDLEKYPTHEWRSATASIKWEHLTNLTLSSTDSMVSISTQYLWNRGNWKKFEDMLAFPTTPLESKLKE